MMKKEHQDLNFIIMSIFIWVIFIYTASVSQNQNDIIYKSSLITT